MTKKQIISVFLAALVLRLLYLGLVGSFGGDFANDSDSGKFLKRATNLLTYGKIVFVEDGILTPDTARMPIYPYFLAGIFGIFGNEKLWLVGAIQAFIDASTVISIGLIAAAIDKRWALPSAILGCGWITLIIYSSYVLSDTIFLCFFCWGLCATIWSAKTERVFPLLCVAGLAFSCALLTRPVLLFFPCLLFIIVTYYLLVVSKITLWKAIGLSTIPPALMIAVLIPRIISIESNYGEPAVTTQTGNHALDVVDQFLRLCPPCVAARTEEKMHQAVKMRLEEKSLLDQKNPVVLDKVRRSVAFEFLTQVPVSSLVIGTTGAILRSALQTGVYESGHQLNLTPSYFSSMGGKTLGAKVRAFSYTLQQEPFLIIWLLAQLIAVTACLLQIYGSLTALQKQKYRPYTIVLLAIGAYFLTMNGPFGNPRYGMPLTPVFIILTASGILALKKQFVHLFNCSSNNRPGSNL